MAIAMKGPQGERAPTGGSPAELDRPTLVRCKAHDREAFRAFVVRYQRPVFACLSRMLGRGPHVEDLAQEVFLRAYRAMPTFDLDGAAKPSTWLLADRDTRGARRAQAAGHPDSTAGGCFARRARLHARDGAGAARAGARDRSRVRGASGRAAGGACPGRVPRVLDRRDRPGDGHPRGDGEDPHVPCARADARAAG